MKIKKYIRDCGIVYHVGESALGDLWLGETAFNGLVEIIKASDYEIEICDERNKLKDRPLMRKIWERK